MRLQVRDHLPNMKVQGEAVSANVEGRENYPGEPAKSITTDGYIKQEIFSVEKAVFCWKNMPSRTLIA